MIENVLGSLLGYKNKNNCETCEKEDEGIGKYLIYILIAFVLLGGLKLFIKQEEKE